MIIFKNFLKYCLIFSLALMWLLCIPIRVEAKTYYVAINGDDDNPGTEENPWLTIQKAADIMVAGDTVLVKPGEYNGTTIVSVSGATYRSFEKHKAKVGKFYLESVDNVEIDGFDFVWGSIEMAGSTNKFCLFRNNLIHSPTNIGIDFGTGEDNIVEGNEIFDIHGHGVHTSGATKRTIVRNNIIHDCEHHGLGMVGGEGEKYLDNIIYNIGGTGIHPGSGGPTNGEIRGNLVYGCGTHAMAVSGSNFLIENNTCIGKNGIDHQVYYISGSGHKLRNNIGYRSDGLNFVLLIPTGAVSDYNCWYDPNNPKCISRWYSPVTLAELQKYGQDIHSISQDPRFVNMASRDFHLQPNSPCIDAGDPGTPADYDLDGRSTPLDGDKKGVAIVDMGAYEYPGATPPVKEAEVRNRPNPFRAGEEVTLIEYNLREPSNVTIKIYDLLGQEVWRKSYRAGENGGSKVNSVPWDGRNLSGKVVGNGGYICRVWIEREKRHMVGRIAVAK